MKKVVSATLAGALAVGMVPAMAFAADGADADLELLVEEDAAIAAGSVVLKDGQTDGQAFAYGSKGHLVPVKVKPMDVTDATDFENVTKVCLIKLGTAVDGTKSGNWVDNGAAVYYTAWTMCTVVDGKLVAGSSFEGTKLNPENLPVGKYAIGAYVGDVKVKEVATFSITGADATGLEFFDNSNGAKADPAGNYNIDDEAISFMFDVYDLNDGAGLGLKIGSEDVTAYFDITAVKDAKGKLLSDDASALFFAGSYNVQVTGKDKYAGIQTYIPVTIDAIDVSKLNIALSNLSAIEAAANDEPAIVAINGNDSHFLLGLLNVDSLPLSYTASGTYNVTVNADDFIAYLEEYEPAEVAAGFKDSVYGTASASFTVATYVNEPIVVCYNGVAGAMPATIDYSDPAAVDFAENAISVKYDNIEGVEKTAANADEVITYNKWTVKGWEPCKAADLKNSGKYQVTVGLKATADQAFTPEIFEITVTYGTLTDANVSVTHKGAGVYNNATIPATYDGTDVMEDIAIVVRDGKGAAIPTSDYTVTILNTEDKLGKPVPAAKQVVSKIVDAGEYTIAIKSTKYDLDETYGVTVSAETVYAWADGAAKPGANNDDARLSGTVYYTGKAIDPVAFFTTKKTVDTVANTHVATSFDVDAAEYKVTISKFVPEGKKAETKLVPTEIKEAGTYTFTVADVAEGNVAVQGGEYTLVVTAKHYFTDVPTDAWYAEVVNTAYQTGIVNGIEGTKLFAPDKAVKRGDFVCMLFNLADGNMSNGSTGSATIGWTSFSDVNANAYYAEAVAWAKEAGIANGHNGMFRPADSMTREEGIAFIANYADACGIDVEVAAAEIAAELAKYPDGAKVSGWAEECVAWACINDVAGNGKALNPKGTITRAEAAAMLVNYAGAFEPARLAKTRA